MGFINFFVGFIFVCSSIVSFAGEIPFTLLFTGDLHSSFETRPNPFGLGGMARIKTAFSQLKKDAQNRGSAVLQLDAGDCSEGSIYYNLGAGVASFEMMNRFDYDAAVVGNHEWNVGPYILDKVLSRVPLNFSFLSANLNFKYLPEENKLAEKIKKFEVFYLIDGNFLKKGENGFFPEEGKKYFKVGVFGLSTNEAVHQFLFDPVRINHPLSEARKMVLHLKRTEKVDVIILVSHLLDEDDLAIAESISSIDVIIGGHSHNKIIPDKNGKPLVIKRTDDSEHETTWFSKTGEFGKFLGSMDLVFDAVQNKMLWEKSMYQLHQMDKRYEDDLEIKVMIENYKNELQKKYSEKNNNDKKDIFNDHIADTEIDLTRSERSESYLGNLVVNAIYEKTKDLNVDFAVNNSQLFSHGLFQGPLHTVDLYHILPLIYDPVKDTSWTIWTFDIDGKTLKKAVDLVFMMGRFFDVEGLEIIYNPNSFPERVVSILHKGEELEDDKIYHVAASQGIIEALKQVKEELPSLANIQDTHIEMWETIRDHFKKYSPIHSEIPQFRVLGKIRTVQPDISILGEDIVVKKDDPKKVELSMDVFNLGYGGLLEEEFPKAKSDPTEMYFYYDSTPDNLVDDVDALSRVSDQLFLKKYHTWYPVIEEPPDHIKLIDKVLVPSLGKDQKVKLSVKWDTSSLPESSFPYTVYVYVKQTSGTGFISVPSDDPQGTPFRKFVKVEESNLHNNKARAFVSLKSK